MRQAEAGKVKTFRIKRLNCDIFYFATDWLVGMPQGNSCVSSGELESQIQEGPFQPMWRLLARVRQIKWKPRLINLNRINRKMQKYKRFVSILHTSSL